MTRAVLTEQDSAIRDQVAVASNVLGLEDLGDFILGHVSLRDPDGRGAWMKATGWGLEEITPDHVLLVGWDGEVLAGDERRHIEWPIHTEILRARPDVHSVVHVHAPHAVAFASLVSPLRPISHEGAIFAPPDVARYTKTGDLIMTAELGQSLAEALGNRNAALMVHHGIVTAAVDVETAVVDAVLLERACRKQLLAMAAGELRTWSSDEEARAKRSRIYPRKVIWDYLVRKLQTSHRRGAD
ncbi:MAG TPA: class II aldolase/adducin family protein [bacterium]